MPTTYAEFDTTPATMVADIKARILGSTDWTAYPATDIVTATTTRGAQMVVNLNDAAPTAQRMNVAAFRSHDGTTGVDRVARFVQWRDNSGATTDPLHCVVSAGKEHLYFHVDGPRGGEPNAIDPTFGSHRTSFALTDIVPYFDTDTVPAVCLVGSATLAVSATALTVWVSRNAGNTLSWVPGRLASVTIPTGHLDSPTVSSSVPYSRRPDGSVFAWPYVVTEQADGPRGRLRAFQFLGMSGGPAGDPHPVAGTRLTVGGVQSIATVPQDNGNPSGSGTTLGWGLAANAGNLFRQPVITVPVA